MKLTDKEKQIILSQVEDLENEMTVKSFYLQKEDYIIRVSNHLPNFDNFYMKNGECTKIYLVLVGEQNECKLQDEIERNMDNFNRNFQDIDYTFILDEMDKEYMFNFIERF